MKIKIANTKTICLIAIITILLISNIATSYSLYNANKQKKAYRIYAESLYVKLNELDNDMLHFKQYLEKLAKNKQ